MAYIKAHPFGYCNSHKNKSKENKERHYGHSLSHVQTITETKTYNVMRRRPVVETRPNGKTKTYYEPVLDRKGKPLFDTIVVEVSRSIRHYKEPSVKVREYVNKV